MESEPNDAADKANSVSVPVVINGKIGMAKDVDRFKFKTSSDQKLVCEVRANRFGSPLDPLLVLEDAKGAVLQQNDDASGEDPRIEFDAKKDAEYILSVRDLTDRGGDDFGYRLFIRPPGAAAPLRRPGKSWPSCRPPRVGRILPRPPHPVKRRAEEARGWGHAVSSDLAGVGDRLGDGH